MLVADRVARLSEYQIEPFQVRRRLTPETGLLAGAYRYVVVPLYTVFPKPGELGNAVAYLLTDQKTVAMGPNADDIKGARVKLNIWPPIWTSAAFVAVVLACTCLFVRRADF